MVPPRAMKYVCHSVVCHHQQCIWASGGHFEPVSLSSTSVGYHLSALAFKKKVNKMYRY
jgi:hypothetical protein